MKKKERLKKEERKMYTHIDVHTIVIGLWNVIYYYTFDIKQISNWPNKYYLYIL